MESQGFVAAVLGGVMVGIAAGLVLLLNGRVAGVSGMLASLVKPRQGVTSWQAVFLVGLMTGGGLLALFDPGALPRGEVASLPVMLAAGLLVGLGARMGGGCTSGHGLCGVGRLSLRSVVATSLFVFGGMVVVLITRHLMGGVQ